MEKESDTKPKEEQTGTMSLKRQKIGEDSRDEITIKSTKITEDAKEEDKEGSKFPKRKLAMIVGYNGAEF